MLNFISDFINKTAVYRLMLYYLLLLFLVSCIYSMLGILPFSLQSFLISTTVLVAVCWIVNKVLAGIFKATPKKESAVITALILLLIVTPTATLENLILLALTAIIAMVSKYILVIGKIHIFNPAAIAVVITSYFLSSSASWWVGALPMLPFVLMGLSVVKKINRREMVSAFMITTLITALVLGFVSGSDLVALFRVLVFTSPLFFFAFSMLTEPLTTPPTAKHQIIYGVIAGFLFAPGVHIGSFYPCPETALVIANIYSCLANPRVRLEAGFLKKLKWGRT